MADDIRAALGFRGDLWVVGAQNVGKSSLINALKRLAGTAGQREWLCVAVRVCGVGGGGSRAGAKRV